MWIFKRRTGAVNGHYCITMQLIKILCYYIYILHLNKMRQVLAVKETKFSLFKG